MSYEIAKALKGKLYSNDLQIGEGHVRIVGIVTGYKTGIGILKKENGENTTYCKFEGQFAHVFVTADGEEKEQRAGYLFVPEILESEIRSKFDSIIQDENFRGMQIAYDLYKVKDPDAKNARGYTWGTRPLFQAEKSQDPLSQLILACDEIAKPKQLTDKSEKKEPKK